MWMWILWGLCEHGVAKIRILSSLILYADFLFKLTKSAYKKVLITNHEPQAPVLESGYFHHVITARQIVHYQDAVF